MAGRFVYYTGMSVDGRIADPAATLEWLTRTQHDAAGPGGFLEFETRIGAIVMGRTTYEWIRTHLPDQPWPYQQPTWVLTHAAPTDMPPGADVRFTSESADALAGEMRAAAGVLDCWVVGGAQCASTFAHLIDEIILCVAPVVLAEGVPLITVPLDLQLNDVQRNGELAILRYSVVR